MTRVSLHKLKLVSCCESVAGALFKVSQWCCLMEMFCRTSCSVNVEHQCVLIECDLITTLCHVCKHVWEVWWVSVLCWCVWDCCVHLSEKHPQQPPSKVQCLLCVVWTNFTRGKIRISVERCVCSLVLLWMVVSLAKGVVTLTDNAWESLLARILSLFQKNSYCTDGTHLCYCCCCPVWVPGL